VLRLPQDQLYAATRADFAHVLRRVLIEAGLGPAQLAKASGIPRSQIYYLIDATRESLPRKEEQIRGFLEACGLVPYQAEFVLTQWRALGLHRKAFGGQPHPQGEAGGAGGVQIRLLGAVRLLVNGNDIPIGYAGVRAVLALLALQANTVVAPDEIIDALWDDGPPRSARSIVHSNISYLRKTLRATRGGTPAVELLTNAAGYTLVAQMEQVDVHQARWLRERAADAGTGTASALLAQALALWTGTSLGGVPQLARHVTELEELRRAIHSARVDADLQLGRHAELIVELGPIVRANPYAERTAGQLMRALYAVGRRADALDLFTTVTRGLAESLGVDPGTELRQLHQQLLNDDLPAGLPAASSRRTPVPAQLPPMASTLAGREDDLAWLDSLAEVAEAGDSPIAVVTGAAGVGKTALAVQWAHQRAGRFPDGVFFASLRGFDPNHSPLDPSEVLAQFLLGVGVESVQIPEQLHERVALYRSLTAGRRMLVLLDDARDAEQVRPLLQPGAHTMTVVTSRSRLAGLAVSNTARQRVVGTLTPDEAIRLIEDRVGPIDATASSQLAALCGYLPLALRIVCARLSTSPRRTPDLIAELQAERTRLATLDVDEAGLSVRSAFDLSYRSLPDDLAHIFRLLGAIPTSTVNPYLVAAVAGIPTAGARQQLQRLAAHSLITEVTPDSFELHDLVRLYLHDLAVTEVDAIARDEILGKALHHYQAVSDRARRRMLRVVDPLDFTRVYDDNEVPAFPSFDEAHDWFARERPNLLALLDSAFDAGRYHDVWRLARVAHTYRVVAPLADEWPRMIDLGLQAAEAAGDVLGQGWMLISRCAIALTFELPQGCRADAERALELAAELGDQRLVTAANIHLGSALSLLAEHDPAIRRLRDAVEGADYTGDLLLRSQALSNCAEAEKRAGRFLDAIAHQLQSLMIDRELGDDSYTVMSLHNLAELNLRIGAPTAAERYAWAAIDLATSREFVAQEGVLRLTLARVLRAKGCFDDARQQLALTLRLSERTNPTFATTVRAELADLDHGSPDPA
jgi:DNA-binding SARP family transcriptional activator/tetratricopeptide (TPR) repeat protein